jgi:hypothetical protein
MAKAKTTKQADPVVDTEAREVIDPNAVVDIKVSTTYYGRVQMLFTNIIASKTQDEIAQAYGQIQNKKIEDAWVQDLETVMILITEFQKRAKEQDKVLKLTKQEFDELLEKALQQDQK